MMQYVAHPWVRIVAHLMLCQIQDISMGWYQWQLFVVVGFGMVRQIS